MKNNKYKNQKNKNYIGGADNFKKDTIEHNYYFIDYANISLNNVNIMDEDDNNININKIIKKKINIYSFIFYNEAVPFPRVKFTNKNCFFEKICREINIRKTFDFYDESIDIDYNDIIKCRNFIFDTNNGNLSVYMDSYSFNESKKLYSMEELKVIGKKSPKNEWNIRIKWIMYQLISTFYLLHKKKIYHGNFVFNDIMITEHFDIKFANFFLYKSKHNDFFFKCIELVDRHSDIDHYAHMLPPEHKFEYNLNVESFNEKMDIWSIGAFLMELACKQNFTDKYTRDKNGLKKRLFKYVIDPKKIINNEEN
jgi:hypothetical protein